MTLFRRSKVQPRRCSRKGRFSVASKLQGTQSPAALTGQGDRTGVQGPCTHCPAGQTLRPHGSVGTEVPRDQDICPRSPHWQGLEPGCKLGMGRGLRLWRPRSKPCKGHAWALTRERPHPVWSAQAPCLAPSQGSSTQVRGRQQVVTL